MILLSAAYLQNEKVQCELWPSRIKRRYCLVALPCVAGSKSFRSHATPSSWSVQPFGEIDMLLTSVRDLDSSLLAEMVAMARTLHYKGYFDPTLSSVEHLGISRKDEESIRQHRLFR